MTKFINNWPKRKPKLKEIWGLSTNNLDCQLAQNKRKNETPKKNFMRTKISIKRDLRTRNTHTNPQPTETPICQNRL